MAPKIRMLLGAVLLLGLAGAAQAQRKVELVRADLGFGDQYKVGSWTPLWLTVTSQEKDLVAVAQVSVPDSDGQSTSISSKPFSLPADGTTTVELLVRIGQLDAPLGVRIANVETGKTLARRTFSPGRPLDDGGVPAGEPATTRMILEIGPLPLGTASAEASESSEMWFTQNLVARVEQVEKLPQQSLAYEAVDTVLLSTTERNDWTGMRSDDPRMLALVGWVRHGGRLILFAGQNADLVFAPDGPLTSLAPGRLSGNTTVNSLRPLESFTGGNEPLPNRGRIKATIPTFDPLEGEVELWLGERENRTPVLIRTRHGLGEVVFLGLDIDSPPLRDWKSRDRLVEKLLGYVDDSRNENTEDYYYDGPADVSLALQQQLDEALESSGIRTPPFLAIAGLVVLYILLIGPGDYFLVKHVLKRMEWTWVTFPLIVVGTCVAAYWLAAQLKGDSLRINQLEILDIDNTTGLTRGTLWTHLFSPSPERYSLRLDAKMPDGTPDDVEQSAVAWMGRPATGMGGMAAEASTLPSMAAYGWSPDRSLLTGVPVEVWSTKTFVSRWQSETTNLLTSDLTRTPNNLLVGTIENSTSVTLNDCRLVYGSWAWKLGTLEAGGNVRIESTGIGNTASAPKKLRNLFKSDHSFEAAAGSYYEQQYLVQQLGLRGLAEMMMFYDALGGRPYTHQWHRHQQFVDLSHTLNSNTAMLVASCDQPRSELARVLSDEPASMRGDKDVYVVLYRFLLQVDGPEEKSVEQNQDVDDSSEKS